MNAPKKSRLLLGGDDLINAVAAGQGMMLSGPCKSGAKNTCPKTISQQKERKKEIAKQSLKGNRRKV